MYKPQWLRDARRLAEFARYRWATRDLRLEIPTKPIFAPADEARFRALLADSRFYLEFGAGASTLIAADAVPCVRSIESDPHFAAAVRRALPAGGDVRVCDPDLGLIGPWGYPVLRGRTPGHIRRWGNYVACALAEIDAVGRMPDFVLIDGRFRAACAVGIARAAAQRGASVTIQFDDYNERPAYHWVERHLGAPEKLDRAAIFVIRDGQILEDIPAALVAEAAADFF